MPEPASAQPVVATESAVGVSRRRRGLSTGEWRVLAVISVGGALGAVARHGLGAALPAAAGTFPWATFLANVTGCLAIGALMVLTTERWTGQRLLRPFLGVGLLGGFTTFSAYELEIHALLASGDARLAVFYLVATVLAALFAVWVAATVTRMALRARAAT